MATDTQKTEQTAAGLRDMKLEIIIGNLLRIGVGVAAAVVFIGGVLYLLHHGGTTVDYKSFRGEATYLRTIGGIVAAAFHGDARGIIQLGLLILISTPIARVVFSAVGFAWERDYRYVVITLIVLAVLLYSLLHSA